MTPAAIDVGTDRQLFVDDRMVESASGVHRELHSPVTREVAIAADRPWEQGGGSYMVTFRDGDRFRAWYRCDLDPILPGGREQPLIAYAESTDGISWEKPDLGLIEFKGSRANNLVWAGPGSNMAPFLDEGPDVPEEARYKAIIRKKQIFAWFPQMVCNGKCGRSRF